MNTVVRSAQKADIPTLLELAEKKRQEYEAYQPVFWRVAPDALHWRNNGPILSN